MNNINIELENDDYYEQFKEENSPRTNYGDELQQNNKHPIIEFEKLTEEERKLYSEIEHLIIMWSNDGTKTAGSLTREIMSLLMKKNIVL